LSPALACAEESAGKFFGAGDFDSLREACSAGPNGTGISAAETGAVKAWSKGCGGSLRICTVAGAAEGTAKPVEGKPSHGASVARLAAARGESSAGTGTDGETVIGFAVPHPICETAGKKSPGMFCAAAEKSSTFASPDGAALAKPGPDAACGSGP
jgi:hypothetical protein